NNQIPVLNSIAYMANATTLVTWDGQSFATISTNLPNNIANLFTDGTSLFAACLSNATTCNIYTLSLTGTATLYVTISATYDFIFNAARGFFFANGYLFTNTYSSQNGTNPLTKINSNGTVRYIVENANGNTNSITDMNFFLPYASGIVGVSNYGYTIFSFGDTEIIPAAPTIASTITDICNRAGLTSIDTTLLPSTPVQLTRKAGIAARDILKALCQVYLIDMVDSAGTLRFVPKGQNISAQIGIEEVGFADVTQGQVPGAPYSLTRSQGFDLPRSVTIEYTSALIQFNRYAQQFQILFPEGKDVKTSVPLTLGDTQALNVAEFLCTSPHIEKNAYAWTLSFKWLQLEPGDVIQMPWGVTRITQVTIKDGQKTPIIEYQGVIDASYVLNGGYGNAQAVPVQSLGQIDAPTVVLPAASGGNFVASNVQGGGSGAFVPVQPPLIVGNAYASYVEVPPIISSQTAPFYLIAPYSSGNSFVGAQVWESTDGGVTFNELAEQSNAGIVGFVQQALPNTQWATWDMQTVVNVYLNASYMQLSSATDIQVIQGANLALVGNELIQFANANLMVDANGVSYYQISRLLRGRRGTEWAMGTQVGQDAFTMISQIDDTAVPYALTNLNNNAEFKIVTVGQDISTVNATNFAPTGVWYKPFSPVNLKATMDTGNNWNVSFTPRARLNGWWMSGVAPTLDPDTQSWSIDILSGTTVKRTVSGSLSTPSFQYTAAMQTADGFADGQHGIIFHIFEVGQLGRGTVGSITS
ncbi:MAG: phage tail protein, partial [Burkholderiales bacterium]